MPSSRHAADADRDALSFDTLAVHAGAEPDELTGAVAPPIYQTSTYRAGRRRAAARAATSTPARRTRPASGSSGRSRRSRAARHGFAFASGSAATAAIAELAGPGEEIVVGDDVYGGTYRYLERVRRPGAGVDADLRRPRGGPGRAVGGAVRADPARLVRDADEPAAQGRRHRRGRARRSTRRAAEGGRRPLIVVDNTFASPAIQRPLTMGADIVFHSATKYLAGHSDTILGVAVTSDDAVAERLRFLQNAMGAVPGPLDCFLVLRGLRTLHLRVERHQAERRGRRRVPRGRAGRRRRSRYPGFGGMVSFVPAAGGVAVGRPSGRSRSPRARGCSPWPNRSAGSSRSSRCRPR